jgi:DNA-directed RNA polymerase alpha subunit
MAQTFRLYNRIRKIGEIAIQLEKMVETFDSKFPEIKAKDSPYYHEALSDINHYKVFLINRAQSNPLEIKKESKTKNQMEVLSLPIECLDLSSRAYVCTQILKIKTIGDLVKKTDEHIIAVKNSGRKTAEEINNKLKEKGLSLSRCVCNYCSKKHENNRYGHPKVF